MFRLFQIDPETSAIHFNTGAFLRHKRGTVFLACLDAFRQNQLFALWQTLWRLPDTEERAFAALFTSQLVHELRHYIDLVLTPYGFNRLRTGFEFYRIAPMLLARAHEKMILPLSSGLDPFFQQELHVPEYARTFAHVIAKIAAARAEIIGAENRPHKLETGLFMELGGDAILEALAFGYQVDLLQHPRFNTPALRRLMPYAYESAEEVEDPQLKKEITQFDLRYRWHYVLLKIFTQERTIGATRLMYCILFSALCGSFAKDANYKPLRIVDKILDPADVQAMESGGRFIDDRLPSNRLPELLAWMGNYVERGGKIPERWTDNWELVGSAHRHLWGTTPVEEIRMDIASDQRLIEKIAEGDSSLKVEAHPFNCFIDLVRIRNVLVDLLDKDPGAILEPPRICETIDRHVTVPIYHVFPDGMSGPIPGTKPIIEDVIEVPDRMARALARQRPDLAYPPAAGTRITEKLCYSAWELKTGSEVSPTLELKAREAWPTLLGFFAPLYKLSLYGLRYRTMLEYDLVKARRYLDANQANLLWNDYYLSISDVSSPAEYFHFYAIDEADCDLCSKRTRANAGVIVSAGTLRDSPAFMAYYRSKFDDLADYFALDRDWSVWLLCFECYRTYLGAEIAG